MERRVPRPGEIYIHFKNKPYQIITIALDSETRESVVVYQALYGDYKTYVRTLTMFMSEVDHMKYPEVIQKYRFELRQQKDDEYITIPGQAAYGNSVPDMKEVYEQTEHGHSDCVQSERAKTDQEQANSEVVKPEGSIPNEDMIVHTPDGEVNLLLMKFLDAESYSKKLEVLTSNRRHLDDRIITDMAVALDLAVEEGSLDQRITGLINCLQAMCRFEDRRLR